MSFSYDAAGNRISMSDGSGTLAYSYDELSRMTSETKVFADTLVNAPSGGYELQYTYHLTGGIKSIKDPHSTNGWEVTYASDKTGRMTAIGAASGFGGRTSFAANIAHRAFGGVKSMAYATTSQTNISLSYDTRLRPATYEAESSANTIDIQNKTYVYTPDGSIKRATNTLDADYSQKYEYDFAGRLKTNKMGGLVLGTAKYNQTLGYDAFGNLASRSTTFDGTTKSFTAGYTNNRKSSGGFGAGDDTFDAAGNVVVNTASYTPIDQRKWKFDAAGRTSDWEETSVYAGTTRWDQGEEVTFDGNGRAAKRTRRTRLWASPPSGWVSGAVYHLYSSVTGREMVELDSSGQWQKRNIYFNGTVIAEQTPGWGVRFTHTDPVAGSEIKTEASGEIMHPEIGRTERAALGETIPTTEPEVQQPPLDYWTKRGGTHNPQYGGCANNQSLGILGPMPCNPSESFVSYLQSVYGADVVWYLRERGGLGTGGVGADNEPHDGQQIPGLHLVPTGTISESGLQRNSWVMIGPPDNDLTQVSVADCSNDGATSAFPFVNSRIVSAFYAAMAAVNSGVGYIGFTEMFRTTEHQIEVENTAKKNLADWEKSWTPTALGNERPLPAAPAGTSSHEAGYSFDIPIPLLKGSRGKSVIGILAANGFVQDIMSHPTFGNDPVHFTHSSWGTLTEGQRQQFISDAQAAFARLGLPGRPGTMPSVSRPKKDRPECN